MNRCKYWTNLWIDAQIDDVHFCPVLCDEVGPAILRYLIHADGSALGSVNPHQIAVWKIWQQDKQSLFVNKLVEEKIHTIQSLFSCDSMFTSFLVFFIIPHIIVYVFLLKM